MTKLDEKGFLNKLYEVVFKLSGISKTQSYRFKKEWDDYLKEFNQNPHLVHQIQVEKDKFLNDIDYRIEVLKNVILSFDSGVLTIKDLLTTLYHSYFNDSKNFIEDFSDYDQLILKYLVAKKILGDLVQYNQLDHETVPLKYNLIARSFIMMKLKGLRDEDIIENLKIVKIDINLVKFRNIMEEIINEGIIKVKKEGKKTYYITDKELELTEPGYRKYNQTIRPLVDWPTLFWRSFYNVRELNVSIEGTTKHSDFLNKILEKAATQGYLASRNVFQNLVEYYKKTKEE